ncbi:MAG: restriction endonuclease [Planctomycetota bacterium]|jgi:hypothetical protein
MRRKKETILDRWQITATELTEVIDANPSLRGIMLGYLAEVKLRHMWFDRSEITKWYKYDDHDRRKKGDLVIIYKEKEFIIEAKSLQTNTVKHESGIWSGKVQCDASDRRTVELPNGKKMETTCLLVGEFDLLAVNLFAFEKDWRFVFAKNSDLPRSRYRKYTKAQQKHLLATLIDVTWPPRPPFRDEPFTLLDELV